MKTVLSVQDLSCVGRCSLTVALPVISAMGCRCSVLPTAVLSTHTGFPDPYVLPLTEHIGAIGSHFQAVGVSFDAVLTGYMANPGQIEAVLSLLLSCKENGSAVVVDPAMGDHGKLYRRLGDSHVAAMARLCGHADILLPNLTEAALLTGLPYRQQQDAAYLRQLTDALLQRFPAQAVLITGVSGSSGMIGFYGACRGSEPFSYQTPVIPRRCHGTGDLFAAVFTGAYLQGKSVYASGVLAADFVRRCVENTPAETPHGVDFETQLSHLFGVNCEKSY